jgi:phosphoribosylaminoimidazole-succinocarboxamide synthase
MWSIESYRVGEVQVSYDKQYLRDWLIKVGFKEKLKDAANDGKKVMPPELPSEVVNELLKKYSYVYDKITNS